MEVFGFENNEFSDCVLRLQIFPDGHLDFNHFQTGNSSDAASSVMVKDLSICSPVLAAKSPYFYMLFKNGMKDSRHKNFILRIAASEELGLMDVFKFMYSHKLRGTTVPELLKVLTVAYKFEVTCCMRYCCDLLLKLPMSLQSALEILNLPPAILTDESTQPIKDAASKYKSEMYSLQESAISLSESDVEILLASDELQVQTEDVVLDFAVRWSTARYPNSPEQYLEALNSLLFRFIRFKYLNFDTLNPMLEKPCFERVSRKVHETLFLKAPTLFAEPQQLLQQQQKPRAYKRRSLKLLDFDFDHLHPHSVVHLDLEKHECAGLLPYEVIQSEYFSVECDMAGNGRAQFSVVVRCRKYEQGLMKLGVCIRPRADPILAYYDVELQVAVRMKTSNSSSEYKLVHSSLRSGFENSEIESSEFIAEDSPYFMDDIVRFRAVAGLKRRSLAPTMSHFSRFKK